MKKLSLIFTVVLGLIFCQNVKAQTTPDYYPGKWQITVTGTPNGDSKMTIVLKKVDGKLTGAVVDTTGKELAKLTQAEVKEKTLTAGFNMQNYDVTLTLDPVDDDHIKGSLMGMFEAKGVRVKDNK